MTTTTRRRLKWTDWLFTVLMLALTGTCIFLGHWQMQRLGEKEALIAAVDARLDSAPIAAPPAEVWPGLAMDDWNFQPISLTGTFDYAATVTVFTSLSDARGPYSGPGYWVVTPFELASGGTVYVNRGFVPEQYRQAAIAGELPDLQSGEVTISGLFRPGETAGFMVPEPNFDDRIEWVRDPVRLAAMDDAVAQPLAPFYVDLPAAAPDALPQGGETVVSFPNNHLGYAMTWYGFAIVALVMLGFWLWRQTREMPETK